MVSSAYQVLQALPVLQDRGDKKEFEVEEDRKEEPEAKEIEELWDRQEKAESKALWDPRGCREKLV